MRGFPVRRRAGSEAALGFRDPGIFRGSVSGVRLRVSFVFLLLSSGVGGEGKGGGRWKEETKLSEEKVSRSGIVWVRTEDVVSGRSSWFG